MYFNTPHITTTVLERDLTAHFGDSAPTQDELLKFVAKWHCEQVADENWLTMDTVISASKIWLDGQKGGKNE
jgi:hypothetical protein